MCDELAWLSSRDTVSEHELHQREHPGAIHSVVGVYMMRNARCKPASYALRSWTEMAEHAKHGQAEKRRGKVIKTLCHTNRLGRSNGCAHG